jgi:SAM-dependent methyltransferase
LRRYEETVVDEFERADDERSFYRSSQAYLYDLTAFAMSNTKLPYLERLMAAVPPPARLLDYGCGIGSDGLLLLEAGYQVEFADFDNPSVAYLRWRLEHRGLEAPIHDVEAGGAPSGFEAAYAFDVLEHVDEPMEFLSQLERRAGLVAVNLIDDEEDELPLHRSLPIAEILSHAARGRVAHYGIYHDHRSHLVLYAPPPASAADRLLSRLRLVDGRVRSRLRPHQGHQGA